MKCPHRAVECGLRRLIFAGVALFAMSGARQASAIVFLTTTAQTAGLGAGQSFLDPEAELIVSLSNGSLVGCSASLLAGGEYLLTAAHCVTGDDGTLSANNISIDFANVGLNLSSDSYFVDPAWTGNLLDGGDLALIQLSAPVTSITGYQLDTASDATGDVVTLTGYGNTGVGGAGYTPGTFGTLYYGVNEYLGTFSDLPSVYGYEYVPGGGGLGSQEVMIAPGDSGGASLIDVDGNWMIVGIHDFDACVTAGCTPNGSFGQYGGDTSVYADAAWLDSILGADMDLPEPASLGLFGVAVAALGLVRQRRRAPPRQ